MNNSQRLSEIVKHAHEMIQLIWNEGEHDECPLDDYVKELLGTAYMIDQAYDGALLATIDSVGAILGEAYLKLADKIRIQEELYERRN